MKDFTILETMSKGNADERWKIIGEGFGSLNAASLPLFQEVTKRMNNGDLVFELAVHQDDTRLLVVTVNSLGEMPY